MTALASRGMIVAAPPHPGNTFSCFRPAAAPAGIVVETAKRGR